MWKNNYTIFGRNEKKNVGKEFFFSFFIFDRKDEKYKENKEEKVKL